MWKFFKVKYSPVTHTDHVIDPTFSVSHKATEELTPQSTDIGAKKHDQPSDSTLIDISEKYVDIISDKPTNDSPVTHTDPIIHPTYSVSQEDKKGVIIKYI